MYARLPLRLLRGRHCVAPFRRRQLRAVPCTATTSIMPQAPAETSADEVEALRQQIAALQVWGRPHSDGRHGRHACFTYDAACAQATLQQKEQQQQPAQQPPSPLVAPYSRSYGRTHVSRILAVEDGGLSLVSTHPRNLLHLHLLTCRHADAAQQDSRSRLISPNGRCRSATSCVWAAG